MRKTLILPLLFANGIAATNCIAANNVVLAADGQAPAAPRHDKAKQVAALMEYIGGWEKSNGQWVDPLALESDSSAESDADSHGNASNEQSGESKDETE